jgi:hypothetical protein
MNLFHVYNNIFKYYILNQSDPLFPSLYKFIVLFGFFSQSV